MEHTGTFGKNNVSFIPFFEVIKIRKYHVIFVYILHDKMGKTEKTKVTKIPKTKRRKYWMNETLVGQKLGFDSHLSTI